MAIEYTPNATTQKAGAVLFTIIGIIAIVQPNGALLGAFILLVVLAYMGGYIGFYRKYVFTDTCLEVKNWFDTIETEIMYDEVNNVFYHEGESDGNSNQEDAEIMIVILKDGTTHRLDISPIDNNHEIVALLRSKITE